MTVKRCLFIDAGYLFKQGSKTLSGEALGRHEVSLDSASFVNELCDWIQLIYPDDIHFRTYWYDGAKQGIPTSSQLAVAELKYVKLRLGRINASGQQKGVDTLIVRDLMVLSQEHSIGRAVVLSGDDDLREGIEYAQDRGVSVSVAGIDSARGTSQSVELTREADEKLLIPIELVKKHLSRIEPLTKASTAVTTKAQGEESGLRLDLDRFIKCAQDFATRWINRADGVQIATLRNKRPSVPSDIDGELLRFVVRGTNCGTIDPLTRKQLRMAFWEVVGDEK
jgi:uncharacterized LabA/DUF88 family protein